MSKFFHWFGCTIVWQDHTRELMCTDNNIRAVQIGKCKYCGKIVANIL